MSKTGCVYLLADPRDGAVKYVGASTNPEQRYAQHKSDRCHEKMRAWFTELEEIGMKPEMSIVACADIESLDAIEEMWMKMMDKRYNLLNRNMNITFNPKKVKAGV